MDTAVKRGLKGNSALKVRFVKKLCIQSAWSLVSTYWQIIQKYPFKKKQDESVDYYINTNNTVRKQAM